MQILDLGQKEYAETWRLQKELLEKRAADQIEDTLILVEHTPVYTIGRASGSGGLLTEIKVPKLGSVPVVEIERGGKLTFHGPGQLVGYPIFSLTHRDLRRYLRDLERALVSVINEETLLPARPCPETLVLEPGQLQTGVWVQDKKLASIGVAVKKWVTYHGFAMNLTTDLRYFEAVEPCGFSGSIMTSIEREMGPDIDMAGLKSNVKRSLARRFEEMSLSYGQIVSEPGEVLLDPVSV